MPQYCETCRFWDGPMDGGHDGRCMRYPPAIVGDPAADMDRHECFRGEWPIVDKSEGCGEWKAAKGYCPAHGEPIRLLQNGNTFAGGCPKCWPGMSLVEGEG